MVQQKQELTIKKAFGGASFGTSVALNFVNNSGVNSTGLGAVTAYTPTSAVDWYDEQNLDLDQRNDLLGSRSHQNQLTITSM